MAHFSSVRPFAYSVVFFLICSCQQPRSPNDTKNIANTCENTPGELLPEGAIARCGTTRLRSDGFEGGVAFLGQGSAVLATASDHALRLWDTEDGHLIDAYSDDGHWPSWCATSRDGSVVAASGVGVRVWRVGSHHPVASFSFPGRSNSVALSESGRVLAYSVACDTDDGDKPGSGRLEVYDLTNAKAVISEARTTEVLAVTLTADAMLVASSESNGRIAVKELASGRIAWESRVGQGPGCFPFALAFSPDDSLLACAGGSQPVTVWRVPDFAVVGRLDGDWQSAQAVAFSPDGTMLAVGGGQDTKTAYVYNTESWEPIWRAAHHGSVSSLSFSRDSKSVASASGDGVFRVWDAVSGTRKLAMANEGHTGPVRHLEFSPDGSTLVSAGGDRTIRGWDTKAWKQTTLISHYPPTAWQFAVSPDSSTLAVPGDDCVRQYSLVSGQHMKDLPQRGHVYGVAFSAKTGRLFTAGNRGIVAWDIMNWEVALPVDEKRATRILCPSQTSSALTYDCAGHGGVRVLDVETGETKLVIAAGKRIHEVAASSDGRMIAASVGSDVVVYDGVSGERLSSHSGREGVETALAISPNLKWLAAGCCGGRTVVVNIRDGSELVELKGHRGLVDAVAFSADGKLLATAGTDTTVLVWNMESVLGQ